MSRPLDPGQESPSWCPPVPCEDGGALLGPERGYFSGHMPRVCRSCQNQRYEAKIDGTPEGERRKRRKALVAKKRRLESRLGRDQAALAHGRCRCRSCCGTGLRIGEAFGDAQRDHS